MHASSPSPLAQLTIRAETDEARRAVAWLECTADAHKVPAQQIVRLAHCLDEALANVIAHAGPVASTFPVDVQFAVERTRAACTAELIITYAGAAFDPTAYRPSSKPESLAQAKPGGLGLQMIRHFSDDVGYRRSGGRNHLTIVIRWTDA